MSLFEWVVLLALAIIIVLLWGIARFLHEINGELWQIKRAVWPK